MDTRGSRLPYVEALIEEVGLDALIALEVELVRTRPIPRRLADAIAADPQRRGLTPHEIRLVRMVAEGMTKTEMAETLDNSVETIKTHFQHIHRKLESHTPAQLVVRAIQTGYLQV